MPRPITVTALAFSLVTIAGCAGSGGSTWVAPLESDSPMYTAVSPSAAASLDILRAAPICCDSLSGLHYQPLNLRETEFYKVDASSQAFQFTTGKSLLRAFVIPDDLERATLIIDAIAGATVFVPTVLILDREFRVSRAVDAGAFKYTPAGFMEPQRLRGKVNLDRRQGGELAAEKYIVIFTTDKDLKGSTRMMSEAKLYARAHGLVNPGLPDPVAGHAATGVFRLGVTDLETAVASGTQYVREQRGAGRYVSAGAAPAVPTAAPTAVPTTRAQPAAPRSPAARPVPRPATTPPPMLRETQAMYDRMIEESVSLGDMDRAWRLVQEAERAGSRTARATFVKAVENK